MVPAVEATAFRDMPAIEQTATVVEDAGQAADDVSSAEDVAKKAEAIDHQLTSESDVHPSPEADPEGGGTQKVFLELEGDPDLQKTCGAGS